MEKLLTAKLHVGVEEPHTLCGGAIDSLAEAIEDDLEMGLQAVANHIMEKYGVHKDGGEGKVKVVVEV
jgi:hypothetical protein